MTPAEMPDTIHGPVPGGADLVELCTRFRPPNGRICLAMIRDGVWLAPCDQCQELLGQMLAAAGVDR